MSTNELYTRLTSNKATILLVDDDANILDTVKDILEEAHYEISTAPNGAEAIKLLDEKSFNAVVVDFQLPDSTGLELARKVRERNDYTLVILMTGHASLEMAVKAIQEAVYDYLIKPVDPAQLTRTIERALEKQRLVLENKQLLEDLQRTNAAMTRLDTLKSQMITVLSHDLRTPLSSIRGYSELLKSGVKGRLSDSQKRMTDITIQEADHLNGLIGDLLDLASLEAGKLSLDLRAVPFVELVEKAAMRVKVISELKEVPVEIISESSLPSVQVDQGRIVQIIANLLRSSLKHATRGGKVIANAIERDGKVELKISYAGQGFSADKLKSLFAVLRGADEPHGTQDGLRIALALAREIIHAHGGEIGVDSRGEDHGSTFWIRLPIAKG
jgi:two-component system, sensor histidine kinase and response regulator